LEARAAEETWDVGRGDGASYAAANSSVLRCALNVVMVVELLVDEDRVPDTVDGG